MTAKQARATLDRAIGIIEAAENLAMATDGAVPPTREVMTSEQLDELGRLVVQARRELEPSLLRKSINLEVENAKLKRG